MGNGLANEEAMPSSARSARPRQPQSPYKAGLICKGNIDAASNREESQLFKFDMTRHRRSRCGHHRTLRRWQNLINGSEEITCRICNGGDETYDHSWLRCPAFDVDRKRLNFGVAIDGLTLFPPRAHALLWIIFMRLW